MVNQTLSLTDKIYAELVDGLGKELDWTAFIAKYNASKGPLYNAIARFLHDIEPKVRDLNEVQARLEQVELKRGSLDQQVKEAEDNLRPLEARKTALSEQVQTLETKVAEKRELLKYAGELGKLGFDTERLRQLRDALTGIEAKSGLKGKEALSTFFEVLKDFDTKTSFEQEIQRLETIVRTRTLEAERWQAETDNLSRHHKDLAKVIAAVQKLGRQGIKAERVISWDRMVSKLGGPEVLQGKLERYYGILRASGFDEKAISELTGVAEKYGTPRKVLRAVNQFGDLSKIKATAEESNNKIKQKQAMIKSLGEQYSHLKEPIELCKKLMERRFGLSALQLINVTARRYGEPTEVMKAIEAYGSLEEIKRETGQAKTVLAEVKGKVEAEKETYAEYNARNAAVLDQLEALNAKSIEVGGTVGRVQEQLKGDILARNLLILLQNPVAAGYDDSLPLVLVLLKGISVWANINKDKFRLSSLIDKNLEELTRYLSGS